jgi:Protein of unknown function (DUF742)
MSTSRQLDELLFGGWGDYDLWADHDFRLRSAVEADRPDAEPELAATQPALEPVFDPPADDNDPRPMVRPYARTGGRTRPAFSLELETLLSCEPGHETELTALRGDYQAICLMCRTPQSTAELAAHLGLPLGAARVLIADVVDLGLLHVHQHSLTAGNQPSMELLYRVRSGLRNLV